MSLQEHLQNTCNMEKYSESHPEGWKLIPNSYGVFMVSSYGRVRNIVTGNFISVYNTKGGYSKFSLRLRSENFKKTYNIHRVLAEAFLLNPCPSAFNIINHKDGNKSNYDLNNLEWIDNSGNILHAMNNHLNLNYGETHTNSKLSNLEAEEIKNSDGTCVSLSKIYGVSPSTICLIRKGGRYNTKH